MAAGFDAKLTNLAAEILRDAVQVYDVGGSVRLLGDFNPFLTATGAFPLTTGAFPGATGAFSTITALPPPIDTSSPSPEGGATGPFKALTGAFRSITESFRVTGRELSDPTVTLRRVFRLPGKLPGVILPSTAELASMARSAPTMTDLGALARWLGGAGRLVTGTDELTDADVAEACQRLGIQPVSLSLLWDYALTSGWFELVETADRRRTWAVVGETASRWADGDDQGALHVWAVVFAATAARTLDVVSADVLGPARRLDFQRQGVTLPVMLFLSRRCGMTTRDLEDLVRQGAVGDQPPRRVRRSWDAWVRTHGEPTGHLLRALTGMGAVRSPRRADATVELTPLALWALREQFGLDKISVPVLSPPSPRMSAAELIALCDAVSGQEFTAAFTTWARGRSPERAVQELLLYAGSSLPHGRLVAVDIARRIGLPAYRAWKEAMKRPELRGYARITLTTMASDLPRTTLPLVLDLDPGDMSWLATDLLAMACGADHPDPDEIAAQFAEAVPAGEEARIFGLMAQSSHPDVARVLRALSTYHPDRRIARGARKAAHVMAKNRRLRRTSAHNRPRAARL